MNVGWSDCPAPFLWPPCPPHPPPHVRCTDGNMPKPKLAEECCVGFQAVGKDRFATAQSKKDAVKS